MNSVYNLINNFSIIACGVWRATAYLLTCAQHTLRAGIVRVDRELFHQIIVIDKIPAYKMIKFLFTIQNEIW